jgi:fumarate reductase subunit C
MTGWWWRNAYYRAYMVREASSVFVAAYALVLLFGLARLAQGRVAFDGWRESLASPWAIAFHVVALAFFACHAWTWFAVMPKTMPFVRIGGQRVTDRRIVATGAAAAVVASAALFAAVWWTRP